MLERQRDTRWSAHITAEKIIECSHDTAIQYLYIGRCCLENEDSAESVVSYMQEDRDADMQPTKHVLESSSPTSLTPEEIKSEEKAASTALDPRRPGPKGLLPERLPADGS
jgi:hypothetical protein